jgi:uncharacterized protein YbjQ (UPF0145 family)
MVDLVIFLVLLALGYGFGRYAEVQHYKSIMAREETLRDLPVMATKRLPADGPVYATQLVGGNVVISVDYFKNFIAGLRNLLGGRVTSYETLVDRARREAILRMKDQAQELGAKMVFNLKLETCSIYRGRRSGIGSVEVFAYGTALIPVS